jgi:hypothetical protein
MCVRMPFALLQNQSKAKIAACLYHRVHSVSPSCFVDFQMKDEEIIVFDNHFRLTLVMYYKSAFLSYTLENFNIV